MLLLHSKEGVSGDNRGSQYTRLSVALGLGELLCSRKKMRMQADIRLKQSSFPGMCPLCNTPLTNTGPTTSQGGVVMCPACGFCGPFIQRQQHHPSQSDHRHQQTSSLDGPSVWIDPAVSAFLVNGQAGQVEYTQSILPRSQRHAKKPQSVSAFPNKGPETPIPPRATAKHANNVKVRPKYFGSYVQLDHQESDITRIPTYPQPTVWQYESPDFEVESSLPALSLIIDAPNAPPLPETSFAPRRTDRLPYFDELDILPDREERQVNIDEIDTNPLRLKSNQVNIDEIDTLPPLPRNRQDERSPRSTPPPATMALVPASSNLPSLQSGVGRFEPGRLALTQQITDPSSWTAGSASGSPYAKRIVEQSTRARRRRRRFFHPIDALRWWLLHPGRLEFILWLGGTMLLLAVTFTLLFVTAISLSWMVPVQSRSLNINTPLLNSSGNNTSTPISVTRDGMTLTLFDTGPIEPGQALHLRGKGFSPHGRIVFTDEKNHPMLKQDSQTNSVQADEHGVFTVTLNNTAWTSGRHNVVVRDVVSGHTLELPVIIDPSPIGKKATPTPVPGLTATATSTSGPGVFPTAVGATPVPPKPTVGATPPAPTPTRQPSPTPTATSVVTPTATPGITPTAGTTPTVSSNSSSSNGGSNFMPPSAAASIEGSADVPSSSANALSSLGAGVWLFILGYMLALFLLGIAGVLRKRHT